MNEKSFVRLRPFLYHLTARQNLANIFRSQSLLSTKMIIESSNIDNKNEFLCNKRPKHVTISIDGVEYRIRDQKPISLFALQKCLIDNWNTGDFIAHLNRRIFFWCTIKRLMSHFRRYEKENPVIIRCSSADLLELNKENVEYCRINSGATRPIYYLGGIAVYRGPSTFLKSGLYPFTPGTVAEVTVVDQCRLPSVCFVSDNPEGPWRRQEF